MTRFIKKRCKGCGENKTLAEYEKCKTCKFGTRAFCRLCVADQRSARKKALRDP